MIILFIVAVTIFTLSLSSIITLCSRYSSYKRVYKTLKYRKFYLNKDRVYSQQWGDKDDCFVWFTKNNDFRLEHSNYLHNSFVTYCDPYSLYWLIKYRRWFKENVDLNTIPNY